MPIFHLRICFHDKGCCKSRYFFMTNDLLQCWTTLYLPAMLSIMSRRQAALSRDMHNRAGSEGYDPAMPAGLASMGVIRTSSLTRLKVAL